MKDTIKKLTEAYGPSGHEQHVRSLIRAEIEGLADGVSVTRLGSLVGVRRAAGRGQGCKVMLAAHMDEIGVMVSHVDAKGFLRFAPIGGLFRMTLTGGRVVFGDGTIGVIDIEKLDDYSKLPSLDRFYIDVGAPDKASCPVKVGDAAGFTRPFVQQGKRLIAKSMDDRVGCAILIETMRRLKRSPHEVHFVFSVQEEITLAGAQTAAYHIAPDVALAIDVCGVGDTPEAGKSNLALGKGPAILAQDAGMVAHRGLKELMIRRAEEKRIPYQVEVMMDGATDAKVIQTTRAGVPSGCLSVPCRYIHSPSEMVDYDDVLNSVKLLLAFLAKPIEL